MTHGPPEISQAARDAAAGEIVEYNKLADIASPIPLRQGTHVQRAMDAAVAENEATGRPLLRAAQDAVAFHEGKVARLTKELAAERACSSDWLKQCERIESELSAERAAREKSESFGDEWMHAAGRASQEVHELHQKLALAERERDEALSAANDGDRKTAHSLHAQLASVTSERDEIVSTYKHWREDYIAASMAVISERDILQQKLNVLETLRDASIQAASIMDERHAVVESDNRKLEEDRDRLRRTAAFDIAPVKARCEKLEKALIDWVEWWESVSLQRGPIYQESVKLVRPEALNQSPE